MVLPKKYHGIDTILVSKILEKRCCRVHGCVLTLCCTQFVSIVGLLVPELKELPKDGKWADRMMKNLPKLDELKKMKDLRQADIARLNSIK